MLFRSVYGVKTNTSALQGTISATQIANNQTYGINISGNATGNAGSATNANNVTTTNFTVTQSGSNLVFNYNGSTIFTLSSGGTLTFSDSTTQSSGVGIKAGGVVYENGQTINSNYTMTTNYNGVSAGPITVADGVTVTIPDNSNWSIV